MLVFMEDEHLELALDGALDEAERAQAASETAFSSLELLACLLSIAGS